MARPMMIDPLHKLALWMVLGLLAFLAVCFAIIGHGFLLRQSTVVQMIDGVPTPVEKCVFFTVFGRELRAQTPDPATGKPRC
ncbi:hypothetical protein LGH83_05910 [Lichenihabitans sp. PAMC28606]|uniref:hypothetical protein n=1 Tax=Lichenihabitans sp. PAMC28606 TaxID=2880932 RepID=UPI001D0B0767|nr:hypothetical protein [Lichenihabitans sp. PAMC28606]UDL95744.1 hypothetical protein LGH83_05910 [Lichenihabitans sp. PAMC28606]